MAVQVRSLKGTYLGQRMHRPQSQHHKLLSCCHTQLCHDVVVNTPGNGGTDKPAEPGTTQHTTRMPRTRAEPPADAVHNVATEPSPLALARHTVLWAHIEECAEPRHRPEVGATTPSTTILDVCAPKDVMATTLLAMARKFSPPWWTRLFTRRR